MRWWHLEQVGRLEAELFAPDSWSTELFLSELAATDTRFYLVAVACASSQLRGYAGLAAYAGEAFVQTLAVAPEFQRRGLGRHLLSALIARARELRAASIALEVRVDNLGAQELYRQAGFTPIGRRPGYYQPSNTDALIMRADLGEQAQRPEQVVAGGGP